MNPSTDAGPANLPAPSVVVTDPAFKAARAAVEIDSRAASIARRAVEDALVNLRDGRISCLSAGNGFVIREPDGTDSATIRLSTFDGLVLGITAYLAATDLLTDKVDLEHPETPGD